jgi:TonB family protein
MKRRDHSAAIGLCVSLVMHAGIVAALLAFYVKDMDARRWWPAIVERGQADAMAVPEADRMVWRDGEFGEKKGAGEALNALDAVEPYLGKLGPQDQAPLSRDPVGNGKLADDPALATALKEGTEAKPLPPSIAGGDGASAPFGVGSVGQDATPAVVAKPPIKAIAIEEKGPESEPVKVAIVPQQEKAAQPAFSEVGGEGKSEKPQGAATANAPAANVGGQAGDPSPMSESESDAFSRMGSINVRNGRVEARLGRSFKSVKPRLSLKGELDAISIAKPVVEMKVYVDETGKVIDVQVLRSSGSNEIDLPTTTAMYKWWIEPAKDKQGKAVKDVILVTFSYL